MAIAPLEFEKPIVELEARIEAARSGSATGAPRQQEIRRLEKELQALKTKIYSGLTPWQRVQMARHMMRPHTLDYVYGLFTDWTELRGDRRFADDSAMVCGLARFEGQPVAVIGQQKGKETRENLARNFGMAHPEGYRKALRIMKMAEKFELPIIVFIDTPGAFPGIGAEERGQAEAIARNIMEMSLLEVPILCVIIGEGASGGALGIGIGDSLLMLENAWYCVISPEGCASILWRDATMAPRSAEALKLTAKDLLEQGIIDEIIPEPLGGAHRHPDQTTANVKKVLHTHLKRLMKKSTKALMEDRFNKYRKMGVFLTE